VRIVVSGSAARPWPVDGCGCPACRAGAASPAGLRAGRLVVAAGRVDGFPVEPGDRHEVDGVRVIALPGARPDRPVIVVGAPDSTVLWAEGPGRLPEETVDALTDARLDAAALDLRDDDGHPEPRHLAHAVARLRAVGALGPAADVVALGRTHELNPGPLERRLALWGARVAPDGGELPAPEPAVAAPWRTLVLGPASSGKSASAEDLLAAEPAVVYAATGPVPVVDDPRSPDDQGWAARVAAHRGRRPPWWSTDESGQLAGLLAQQGPPLLVDALGTWVAAVMDRAGAWDDAAGWRDVVEGEVDAVVAAWRQARRRVVAVGEEVGWGVVPADRGVTAFREVLGALTRRLAEQSERVVLVVAGRTVEL
jgi:adenosylcobinamide kinase/adenosylcobinamide-phosphate guanylyltransferase